MNTLKPMARAEYCFDIKCNNGFCYAVIKEIPKLFETYDIFEHVTITSRHIKNDLVRSRIIIRNPPGETDESLFDLAKAIMLSNYDAELRFEKRYV